MRLYLVNKIKMNIHIQFKISWILPQNEKKKLILLMNFESAICP